jgi:biopolymer transport protein ExbD
LGIQSSRSPLTQRPSGTWRDTRRGAYYCRINPAPIAGILAALWLLFASMFTGSDMTKWNSMELVNASHSVPIPAARRDDAITVGLSASGDLYFRSRKISLSELGGNIREGLNRGAENRIYLNVDSRTQYADVKSVLHQISSVGVENITFITR